MDDGTNILLIPATEFEEMMQGIEIDIKRNLPEIIGEYSTRSGGSLAEVNFTRIKRHRDNNNARYIIVVAPDFDPAIRKNAERENVCLLPAKVLGEILRLNKDFSLAPPDLKDIISTSGLVDDSKLEHLRKKYSREVYYVKRLLEVMEELKTPQSLDTLYGVIRTIDRYEKHPETSKIELLITTTFLFAF
jgi:hypothetical protein